MKNGLARHDAQARGEQDYISFGAKHWPDMEYAFCALQHRIEAFGI